MALPCQRPPDVPDSMDHLLMARAQSERAMFLPEDSQLGHYPVK